MCFSARHPRFLSFCQESDICLSLPLLRNVSIFLLQLNQSDSTGGRQEVRQDLGASMHSLPLLSPFTLTFQVSHQKLGAGSSCLIPCTGQSSVNLAYSSGQNSLDRYILGMQSIVFISHGIDQLTICFLLENSFSKDIAKQNACMAIQLKLNLVHAFLTSAAAKSLDGSPPGSPVPGILQARTLEWVAISFSF